MGIGSILGGIGSLLGIGSSISNMVGGGNQPQTAGAGGGSPFLYQPTGQPQQDQNYQALLNGMLSTGQSLPGQLLPQYQQASSNITNNPYAGLAQQGADTAGALAPSIAGMQMGGAGSLYNAGNQVLNTAFDPQNALYNRTQQQVMDQINAANAASGVAGPAAAGVADQGINNFNIDWQNNLLNRQIQGITGGGRAFAGASDLGSLAPQTLATGSALPYSTYLGQQQNILGGLNALSTGATSAYSLPQMTLSDIQSYLGLGQSAGANALAGQQQGFQQNQTYGSQLASSLSNPSLVSSLNSLFAPSSTSSTTDPSGLAYYSPGSDYGTSGQLAY